MKSYILKAYARERNAIKATMNEAKEYYQLVYAMTNNDWAAKIGISFWPLKRAKQIGFDIFDPNFRIAVFAIPSGLTGAVENKAHIFAQNIEYRNHGEYMQRSKGIYRHSKDDKIFGFPMRSGGTEVFGISYRQAIGAIAMARNQIELGA